MRIGINFLPYFFEKHGGAEIYLENIIPHILCRYNCHQLFLFGELESVGKYISDGCKIKCLDVSGIWKRSRITRSIAEQLLLPLLCARNKIDCLVSNYVVPLFAPCKTVVIVHDLLYRRYPETFEWLKLFYWSKMIPLSIWRSSSVVTVSQFSAKEIGTYHPSARKKIFITVEGIRSSLALVRESVKCDKLPPSPFLLCVATFGKHKNLHTLLEAFSILLNDYPNTSFIIVGAAHTPDARKHESDLRKLSKELGIEQKIKFAGHLSDEELAFTYKHAIALVLPSLYEGFGLPIIEAQSFGCPVICSNRASLPEIAGHAAITFDPTSVLSIRDSMTTVLEQSELREKLRHDGHKNVSRFSWDKAANQLMEAIEFAVRGRLRE